MVAGDSRGASQDTVMDVLVRLVIFRFLGAVGAACEKRILNYLKSIFIVLYQVCKNRKRRWNIIKYYFCYFIIFSTSPWGNISTILRWNNETKMPKLSLWGQAPNFDYIYVNSILSVYVLNRWCIRTESGFIWTESSISGELNILLYVNWVYRCTLYVTWFYEIVWVNLWVRTDSYSIWETEPMAVCKLNLWLHVNWIYDCTWTEYKSWLWTSSGYDTGPKLYIWI